MSEYLPPYDSSNTSDRPTIELTNNEVIELAPHNTALFEYTGDAASRNHIFFLISTSEGDFKPAYLFRTFDSNTYDELRQHILVDPVYEVVLADEVDTREECAYQQHIDQRVEAWRKNIPDTVLDFLITTAP